MTSIHSRPTLKLARSLFFFRPAALPLPLQPYVRDPCSATPLVTSLNETSTQTDPLDTTTTSVYTQTNPTTTTAFEIYSTMADFTQKLEKHEKPAKTSQKQAISLPTHSHCPTKSPATPTKSHSTQPITQKLAGLKFTWADDAAATLPISPLKSTEDIRRATHSPNGVFRRCDTLYLGCLLAAGVLTSTLHSPPYSVRTRGICSESAWNPFGIAEFRAMLHS
jgi:hypothetical protein